MRPAILLCLFCIGLATWAHGEPELAKLWPEPALAVYGSEVIAVHPESFEVVYDGESKVSIVQRAVQRYVEDIFFTFPSSADLQPKHSTSQLAQLRIAVANPRERLSKDTSELYQLQIRKAGDFPLSAGLTVDKDSYVCLLYAETVFGVIRGLETLSQLMQVSHADIRKEELIEEDFEALEQYRDVDEGAAAEAVREKERLFAYSIVGCPLSIKDTPDFHWRGLLIDSARHFQRVEDILFELDVMAWAKLNVLHWHITDAESFPFESDLFPELREGAWDAEALYSHEDIRRIVYYAADRGIRVVPEFDMPAHSLSWGKGFPEMIVQCVDSKGDARHAMDPTEEKTYHVIDGVLSEAASLFPDHYVHLGFDEFHLDCWLTPEFIAKALPFREEHGIGPSVDDLLEYFMTRVKDMAVGRGKKIIVWEEAMVESLIHLSTETTAVQAWRGWKGNAFNTALQNGYDTLLSTKWYLDYPDRDWYYFYTINQDNLRSALLEHPENALGGEACMWGEKVDSSTLQSVIWPRAAAVAEQLWHFNATWEKPSIEARLEAWRCRSHQRGLEAAPLFPDYCPSPPQRIANKLAGSGPQLAPAEPKTIVVYERSTGGVWWLVLGILVGSAVGLALATFRRSSKRVSLNVLWAAIGCLFCTLVILYALTRSSP